MLCKTGTVTDKHNIHIKHLNKHTLFKSNSTHYLFHKNIKNTLVTIFYLNKRFRNSSTCDAPSPTKGTATIRSSGDCITNANANCFKPPEEQITLPVQPALLVLQHRMFGVCFCLFWFCTNLLLPCQIFTDTCTLSHEDNGQMTPQTNASRHVPNTTTGHLASHNRFL